MKAAVTRPSRCGRRAIGWAAIGAIGITLSPCHLVTLSGGQARAADKLQYNRDIRPILADNCFACHGPDSAARKADLRLDQREAAIGHGGNRRRQGRARAS